MNTHTSTNAETTQFVRIGPLPDVSEYEIVWKGSPLGGTRVQATWFTRRDGWLDFADQNGKLVLMAAESEVRSVTRKDTVPQAQEEAA